MPKENIPWNKGKKGLQVAWNKGKKNYLSLEARKKIGDVSRKRIGILHPMFGKKISDEWRQKLIKSHLNQKAWNKGLTGYKTVPCSKEKREKIRSSQIGKKRPQTTGENNGRWIKDRSQLKIDRKQAYDYKYREWMKQVKNRDN